VNHASAAFHPARKHVPNSQTDGRNGRMDGRSATTRRADALEACDIEQAFDIDRRRVSLKRFEASVTTPLVFSQDLVF